MNMITHNDPYTTLRQPNEILRTMNLDNENKKDLNKMVPLDDFK